MKELLAFLLPPATALAGMRMTRLVFGKQLDDVLDFGVRFALGLALGMVVFTQSLVFGALIGINVSTLLGRACLLWGLAEAVLLAPKLPAGLKRIRFRTGHWWLLGLVPVALFLWVNARLSIVEGTQEFDAAAFWLVKGRMLYLKAGRDFLALLHTSNLAYTHMDYPLLVPALYAQLYGAIGGIDEFVVKVWPFWMLLSLCIAVLSLARVWRQPHPAPILLVVLLCFVPATWEFVRQEGATMPLLFETSLAALLFVVAFVRENKPALVAGILVLACGAATKLEGVVYSGLWGLILLIFLWRRGWLKDRLLWKGVLIAACLLLPYFSVRLQKPVLYPEAHWLQDAAASPGTVLRRFPQTLFLGVGQRFFHRAFFHWDAPDKEHLHFIGHWQGFDSFAGPELSLLPWLLLPLVALTFWKKPAYRLALTALVIVIVGQLAILALVISCIGQMQADLSYLIGFTEEIVGRYYYPFFMACLLGTVTIWFLDKKPVSDLPTPAAAQSGISRDDLPHG